MNDTVKMLRDYQGWMKDGMSRCGISGPSIDIHDIDGDETFGAPADEIERLEALNAEMLETFEPLIEMCEFIKGLIGFRVKLVMQLDRAKSLVSRIKGET